MSGPLCRYAVTEQTYAPALKEPFRVPNNREWAVLVWVGVLLILGSTRVGRPSIAQLVRLALTPKLLLPVLGMMAWVAGEVGGGARLSLWTPDLATGTVVWFVTVALLRFGRFQDAQRAGFFRRRVLAAVGITTFVEAYLALVTLPLWIELLMQPVLTMLLVVPLLAASKTAKVAASVVVSLCGITLFVYVAVALATTWRGLDTASVVRQLGLASWLTVFLLPYVYGVAVLSGYGQAFLRINMARDEMRSTLPGKLVLLLSLGVRARLIRGFLTPWPARLAAASSFRERRQVITEFKAAARDELPRRQASGESLTRAA